MWAEVYPSNALEKIKCSFKMQSLRKIILSFSAYKMFFTNLSDKNIQKYCGLFKTCFLTWQPLSTTLVPGLAYCIAADVESQDSIS